TVSEAQDFVDKVILYEQADKPKRVVLHQAALNSGNIPDSRCLAWNCDDWVPADWEIIYLFEPSEEEWINAWAKNPLIFQHMGNGGTDWIEISYGVKWYNEDVSKLTNAFWPVFMSPSPCGDFKADDCFAEVLVKDDCGAIAAIAPAGDKFWFSSSNACQYSGKFVEMMFKALFEDGKEHLGDMLNQGKTYMISSVQANSKYRWCYYAFNLIGDPETPVLTKRSSISITNPPDGSRVTGTISITASTLECIDKVKFYIIGVSGDEVNGMLLCEDTIPPFECSWNTPGWSGWCTIRADGYCSGEVRDVDEITVLVENCKVTITYPSEGETVSGTVTCTVNGNCDSVKWYIDGAFKYEDTTAPFQYIWDTTQEPNGGHTIKAEGYISGILMDQGVITCIVDNTGEGLGTTLLSVLILFGFAVIVTKRR
ncbi:MAG: hypothetical protein HXS46_00135, partial [Theionarchaea archaeon]|nr:hypothetical protein [Theionarchaea archaeon]